MICKNCGCEVVRTSARQLYCSDCAKKAHRAAQESWKTAHNKSKKKNSKKTSVSLDKKAKRASELGMTYGKYVCAVENGLIEG